MSNKAVHLFLQTQHGMDIIRDNVEGRRDDDVAVTVDRILHDDRKISRAGFGSLFGNS